MQCKKCNRQSEINLKYLEPLCNSCFCEVIEKRIRKYTRLNKSFRRNDNILITDKLCLFLVKRIIEGLPVRIFFNEYELEGILNGSPEVEEFISSNNISKIVIPWTLDDEACYFLHAIFNNKDIIEFESKLSKNIIKPLVKATNKEIGLYADIKGISFKPNNLFPDVKQFLDSLEEIYPDTKFGLVKSKEILSRLE